MLNKNQSHRRNSWKYFLVIPALIGFVLLFQVKTIAQDKSIEVLSDVASEHPTAQAATQTTDIITTTSKGDGSYVFDKTETDQNLKDDAADISKTHGIKFIISNVKRNAKGEIIAIKIAFDDKNGNKGKIEQNRTIPIRPIFFQVKQKDGKSIMGFYDNPDMVVKPADIVNENKITTIESIKDDAIIYVDGDRYTKEDLNELDPKGLDKIEVLTDVATLTKYGARDKGSVTLVTTNWATRTEPNPNPVNIITIANGDEVTVYNRFNMKIPGYPSVQFTENSPTLIINGVQKNNPRLVLESMPLSKVKDIKVFNDSDKEVKGRPISKVIITLK